MLPRSATNTQVSAEEHSDRPQYQLRHPEALRTGHGGITRDHINRPPSYHSEEIQSTQTTLTWADIEKGASEARQQSALLQEEHSILRSTRTTISRRAQILATLLSKILQTVRSLAAEVSTRQSIPSPPRSSSDKSRKTGSNLASISSSSTLEEAKRSMSTRLYNSVPIRLVLYAILIFNTLLVVSVMADSKTFASFTKGREHSSVDEGQIVLDSGSEVKTKIPCVAAASHNDEMQAVPFTEALSLGIATIEVDTWLINDTMLAAHEMKDIKQGKTLKGIYIDPLFKMLERANTKSERLTNWESEDWKGIFELVPKQELMLMIDVKNDPQGQFLHLLQLLQPFIDKNYLTVYRDGKLVPGPLTIVGTGETDLSLVLASSPRYIFYDAPLIRIDQPIISSEGKTIEWGPEIAPIASSKWTWWSYYPNVEALKVYSNNAHERGIRARWWGVARWPGYLRRALWNLQLKADVDIMNADDLVDVAGILRAKEDERQKLIKEESRNDEPKLTEQKEAENDEPTRLGREPFMTEAPREAE